MRGDSTGAGAGVRRPRPALSEGASTPGRSLAWRPAGTGGDVAEGAGRRWQLPKLTPKQFSLARPPPRLSLQPEHLPGTH